MIVYLSTQLEGEKKTKHKQKLKTKQKTIRDVCVI